jgi:hypothetical protein
MPQSVMTSGQVVTPPTRTSLKVGDAPLEKSEVGKDLLVKGGSLTTLVV